MNPKKYLAYLAIFCFDRQCPEQNTVARLDVEVFAPKDFGLTTLLLETTFIETACISLASRHVPCSTFVLDVQSSTDKKLATTQDRQTLQNSDEKQSCHSKIA